MVVDDGGPAAGWDLGAFYNPRVTGYCFGKLFRFIVLIAMIFLPTPWV